MLVQREKEEEMPAPTTTHRTTHYRLHTTHPYPHHSHTHSHQRQRQRCPCPKAVRARIGDRKGASLVVGRCSSSFERSELHCTVLYFTVIARSGAGSSDLHSHHFGANTHHRILTRYYATAGNLEIQFRFLLVRNLNLAETRRGCL